MVDRRARSMPSLAHWLEISKWSGRRAHQAAWCEVQVDYKLFFPKFLAILRPLEPHLEWLSLGAQYRVTARKRH
jgi:hypothetical protein